MNTQQLWQTFMETGAPEVYLLYHQAKKVENSNVPDRAGIGPSGDTL